MAGALLWGYDLTNKKWIPLQVDENGYVKVDMSNINLDDLADVSVASPTGGHVIYWDAATSLWKAKAPYASPTTTAGDIIKRGATKDVRLAIGSASQVLTVVAGAPAWAAGAGGTKIQDADGDTKVDTEESADEDIIRMDVAGVEAFKLHADGILDLVKQSSCKAYRATSYQSIVSSSPVKIQLNAEAWDIQGEFDSTTNYKFTAKKAGKYFVVGTVTILSLADGNYAQALIYVNGTATDYANTILGAAFSGKVTAAAILSLAVGDDVELYARHDYGSNRDVHIGVNQTSLSIQKLA